MSWMNYTGDNRAARGMEFSTQPFDISHQETVAMSPLFGTPTFRWLPAKAKLQTRFLMFYARVPEGFTRIDDVVLEGGKLTVVDDRGSGWCCLPRGDCRCDRHCEAGTGEMHMRMMRSVAIGITAGGVVLADRKGRRSLSRVASSATTQTATRTRRMPEALR